VVGDIHTSLERDPTLIIYVPYWRQAYQATDLVVRAAAGGRMAPGEVRQAIRSIDPSIPTPKMRTMDDLVAESVKQRRFQMMLAGGFAGSALLLAALGIYGVVAYGVALRRREMGIRIALGARGAELRWLVLRQGMRPAYLGVLLGLGGAVVLTRFLQAILYQVAPLDWVTFLFVPFVLLAVAAVAVLIPAVRASRVAPVEALRME